MPSISYSVRYLESPVFLSLFFLLQGVCCARPDLHVAQRKKNCRMNSLSSHNNLRPSLCSRSPCCLPGKGVRLWLDISTMRILDDILVAIDDTTAWWLDRPFIQQLSGDGATNGQEWFSNKYKHRSETASNNKYNRTWASWGYHARICSKRMPFTNVRNYPSLVESSRTVLLDFLHSAGGGTVLLQFLEAGKSATLRASWGHISWQW